MKMLKLNGEFPFMAQCLGIYLSAYTLSRFNTIERQLKIICIYKKKNYCISYHIPCFLSTVNHLQSLLCFKCSKHFFVCCLWKCVGWHICFYTFKWLSLDNVDSKVMLKLVSRTILCLSGQLLWTDLFCVCVYVYSILVMTKWLLVLLLFDLWQWMLV